MVKHYALALALLTITFGNPARAEGGEKQVCSANGVYEPLTLFKKVQLATAYFVNPSLPDKAEVADVYQLSFDKPSEELRKKLKDGVTDGKIKLMVPVKEDDTKRLTSVECDTRPEGELSKADTEKPDLSLLFKKLAEKEGLLYYYSPEQAIDLPGSKKDGSFISWDPVRSVELGKLPWKGTYGK